MRFGVGIIGILIAALLVAGVAHADATDDAVRRIGLQLQCPVCEGQNVADSNSGLAQDMRAVIRTQVQAGLSDQQILDGFVASYGDGILTEPPKRGVGLGVWLGSAIGIGAGALVLVFVLRGWRRAAPPPALARTPVDADVNEEFVRFRNEFGR
jgi:cytochrome c-type biogenesis protein CcmH